MNKIKTRYFIVYQSNDILIDFEGLISDPNLQLKDLLDDDLFLVFVDPKHFRVWLWFGHNITTRQKFIVATNIPTLRDKQGNYFKFALIDQGNESLDFLAIKGLVEETTYEQMLKALSLELIFPEVKEK